MPRAMLVIHQLDTRTIRQQPLVWDRSRLRGGEQALVVGLAVGLAVGLVLVLAGSGQVLAGVLT